MLLVWEGSVEVREHEKREESTRIKSTGSGEGVTAITTLDLEHFMVMVCACMCVGARACMREGGRGGEKGREGRERDRDMEREERATEKWGGGLDSQWSSD